MDRTSQPNQDDPYAKASYDDFKYWAGGRNLYHSPYDFNPTILQNTTLLAQNESNHQASSQSTVSKPKDKLI